MSCLAHRPSCATASVMLSRSSQNAFDWDRLAATRRPRSRRLRMRPTAGFQAFARPIVTFWIGGLDQHEPVRSRSHRQTQVGAVPLDEVRRHLRHQFESGKVRAEHRTRARQQRSRLRDRAGSRQRRALSDRQRKQLQNGRGDDAERSFGADVQVAQGVAGVVLAQCAQSVPDLAVRGDDLEPECQLARIASGAGPGFPRRWSPGCRRSCSCPRRRATTGTAARRRERPSAPPGARNPLPPPACCCRCRQRECGSCARAAPRQRTNPRRRASRQRPGRCFRPAARSDGHA